MGCGGGNNSFTCCSLLPAVNTLESGSSLDLTENVLVQESPEALSLPSCLPQPRAEEEAEVVGGQTLAGEEGVHRQDSLPGAAQLARCSRLLLHSTAVISRGRFSWLSFRVHFVQETRTWPWISA